MQLAITAALLKNIVPTVEAVPAYYSDTCHAATLIPIARLSYLLVLPFCPGELTQVLIKNPRHRHNNDGSRQKVESSPLYPRYGTL